MTDLNSIRARLGSISDTSMPALLKVVEAAKEYCNSVEFDGQPCHEEYGHLRKALRELEEIK